MKLGDIEFTLSVLSPAKDDYLVLQFDEPVDECEQIVFAKRLEHLCPDVKFIILNGDVTSRVVGEQWMRDYVERLVQRDMHRMMCGDEVVQKLRDEAFMREYDGYRYDLPVCQAVRDDTDAVTDDLMSDRVREMSLDEFISEYVVMGSGLNDIEAASVRDESVQQEDGTDQERDGVREELENRGDTKDAQR